MLAELWKALLRRIPEQHIDNLMMMTAQGTEINVQTLLRMEEDFMVLRGRLAGSTDGGRIFILPYEHLDHMGFQKPLTEAQLEEVFNKPAPPATAATLTEPLPPPQPASPTPAPPAPPPETNLLSTVPTRSKLVQRLRLRMGTRDGANSPPQQ